MSSLPAGWYKDPADPETQRYWDGEGWLGKAIPADAVPPDGPPVEEPPRVAEPPVAPDTPPAGQGPPPPASGPPSAHPAQQPPPPGHPPPGWPPQGYPPPGYPLPGHPPQAWGPPPGWAPPPGWTPPPGWIPPPGFPMGAIPYPVPAQPHGFALAGLGTRLLARIVDIIAVLLLNVVVNGYFGYEFAREFAPIWRAAMADPFGDQPQPTARMESLIWAMLIVATLLWLLYEAPSTATRGQTLGKRIMHIKVVRLENTEPLGFGRAFRRWARLGLWTPFWGCLGIGLLFQLIDSASPLFDPRLRQALHDKTAATVVVALPPNDRRPVGTASGGTNSGGSPSGS
jgi:uncharacterized RDD family membrane protein YckC